MAAAIDSLAPPLDPKLAVGAQRALTSDDLPDPWNDELALWTILAREGSPASARVLLSRTDRDHPSLSLRELAIGVIGKPSTPAIEAALASLSDAVARAVLASDAERWNAELGLELTGDWEIGARLWDAPGDALTRPPRANARVEISVRSGVSGWDVNVSYDEGLCSFRSGASLQNDLRLPLIPSLEDLPEWLSMIERQLDVHFARTDAWLYVGRKRSAKAKVIAWLCSA